MEQRIRMAIRSKLNPFSKDAIEGLVIDTHDGETRSLTAQEVESVADAAVEAIREP